MVVTCCSNRDDHRGRAQGSGHGDTDSQDAAAAYRTAGKAAYRMMPSERRNQGRNQGRIVTEAAQGYDSLIGKGTELVAMGTDFTSWWVARMGGYRPKAAVQCTRISVQKLISEQVCPETPLRPQKMLVTQASA